jgi:hypothetical protein
MCLNATAIIGEHAVGPAFQAESHCFNMNSWMHCSMPAVKKKFMSQLKQLRTFNQRNFFT